MNEKRFLSFTMVSTLVAIVWLSTVLWADVPPPEEEASPNSEIAEATEALDAPAEAALDPSSDAGASASPTAAPAAPARVLTEPPAEETWNLRVEGHYDAVFSSHGGTFKNIYLVNPQYMRNEAVTADPGFTIPQDQREDFEKKRAAGGYDLVTTWSSTFAPFQYEFNTLAQDEIRN